MTRDAISAWHFATGEPVQIHWAEGIITEISPAPERPEPDLWVAPALLDLQVNGFAGIDFQRNSVSLGDLLHAVRGLQAAGCSQFLLTLITDSWENLMAKLRRLRRLRAQSHELQQAIAGWHLEGPFLSPEPGFCGAHDPAVMIDPTPACIQQLRHATEEDPVLLTLAPERRGALETIGQATSLGMRVSLGHTNASAETLRRAARAGAIGFTHFGNACPQQLDRHDNILWRVLDTPGLTLSLIPDRIHVAPALFRLVHRVIPAELIYYTTDAMAAAGAPPGSYTIGRIVAEVGADQIVREPGKTNYAGSALQPIRGAFSAAQMLGCPWQRAWDALSLRPARFMGWRRAIEPGQPADFCLVKVSKDQELDHCRLYCRGVEL